MERHPVPGICGWIAAVKGTSADRRRATICGMSTRRLFVAIPLGPAIKAHIKNVGTSIDEGILAREDHGRGRILKFLHESDFHITLNFLGNVPPENVDILSRELPPCLMKIKPFRLHLDVLGTFPEKNMNRTRLFWMGVDGDMEALNDLETRVTDIVNEHAIIPDRKPPKPRETFTPHITIARVAMNAQRRTRVAVYEEVHSFEQTNHDS
ncbi:hypothetical protein NDN08_000769 [Rhodosorus marinus]|uniref:RNA 2',3'-cyclic phosphodiesterase n=1 Tax=Rhodosorus marinus TaxID=101924 RepID=A0AAV8UNY0_9RHOD|nr:hypothetical protein NDN08_000769 [Rhodosorus marinus]